MDPDDYLRDKPSPHSLLYGNGTSSRYVSTAVTGTSNSSLMVLMEVIISETPPETLRGIVDIIPMTMPPANAFKYYATSIPDPYLWIVWDGPPGHIALPPQYQGTLVLMNEQPGHKALREDVGKPPPLRAISRPVSPYPSTSPRRPGHGVGGGGTTRV